MQSKGLNSPRGSMRARKCKSCGDKFTPSRPLQAVCGVQCAQDMARHAREKKTRQNARKRLDKLKTRSEHIKEAQQAFNAYIRERDRDLPCISCGRQHQGQWHAGHYRSTGSAPHLRFDERNAHKQCQPCNTHLSGNLIEYRKGLIEKIGLSEVDRLECDQGEGKWSVEELQAMKKDYRKRVRDMKKSSCV